MPLIAIGSIMHGTYSTYIYSTVYLRYISNYTTINWSPSVRLSIITVSKATPMDGLVQYIERAAVVSESVTV